MKFTRIMKHLLVFVSLVQLSIALASNQTDAIQRIPSRSSGQYDVEISGEIEVTNEKNETKDETKSETKSGQMSSQIELRNQESSSQVAITKQQPTRSKRQTDRYLQAIDIEAKHFDGEPIPMSPQLDCTSGQTCTLELLMDRTEVVRQARVIGESSTLMEADEIFNLIPKDSVEGAVAIAMASQSRVNLSPNSVGRVMFKPKLMKITGSLVTREPCADAASQVTDSIFGWAMPEVERAPQCGSLGLGPFEIIAPVTITRVNGLDDEQLDGEWYIEYSDNPWPIDRENYHNIRDKDIPHLVDATKVMKSVPNPTVCGQFANDYDFKLAVYRNASCYMKHTVDKMEMTTGTGEFIGRFGLAIPHDKYSLLEDEMRRWVENKSCDIIDFDGKIYFCKKFTESPGAVMMFRRDITTPLLHASKN